VWAKLLNAKNIKKEAFPLDNGKCFPRKGVHNWVEKFSEGRSKVADDARPIAEVAETSVKRLLCCGFRRTGKAMGQVYQCCWRICQEINIFFSVSNITRAVSKQRLSKHVPAATDTHATEVLFETMFSVRFVRMGYKEDN
jgi:hypothetical protein